VDAASARRRRRDLRLSLVLVGLQQLLGKEYRELGLLEPADSET
jgi:hypothetical protein